MWRCDLGISNIKEILELKVVGVLEDGEITENTLELLSNLKTVLLFKYFPDDAKERRRF